MYLTWKRNEQGIYEGNTKTFNDDTCKHEPIFTIEKTTSDGWRLFIKGVEFVISTEFSKLLDRNIEITQFAKLKDAKAAAQRIENKNPRYVTDEEWGEANAHYAPGQEISCYITAERVGGRLYVSDDGNALISETRYPDGRVVTERKEYERA